MYFDEIITEWNNMNIKHMRRVFLIVLFLLGIFPRVDGTIRAQGHSDVAPDSVLVTTERPPEPGALFQVDPILSTSSVYTATGDRLYMTPAANLTNALYGVFPGLFVLQGSGEPGNDAAALRIRGIGTYNVPDVTLFVDGFQTDIDYLQYLAPGEIETISVLKDAAALAPFGMKGANGVLWVTTRRGWVGSPSVQVQFRTGLQEPVHINKPLDSFGYASLYNEAVSNDNGRVWTPAYSEAQLDAYRNNRGVNVDWYDSVLRQNTPYSDADVSVRGGDQHARYFAYVGYLNNRGLYDVGIDDTHSNARHERLTMRANLDFDLFEIFEGRVNLGGRIEDRGYPNYDGSALWTNLARYPTNIYPVKNENGTWTGTPVYPDNPVASVSELGYTSNHDRAVQANFYLKERLDAITPGLYLSQGMSFNNWQRGSAGKSRNYARYLGDEQQTTDQNTNYSVWDDSGTRQWHWTQTTVTAGYQQQFGRHALHTAAEFLSDIRKVDASANGAAGVNTTYAHMNIGGRAHYVYDNRYVAEVGFAFSASDNFAPSNRWGVYPTVSAAWIVSNESFYGLQGQIDFLKLRASGGKSANDLFDGRRYLYQPYYIYSGGFNTGTSDLNWRSGLIEPYVPNPDIFAEESMKYNLGIDTRLFGRMDLTVDAFLDKRTGIITQDLTLGAPFGAAAPYRNVGEVTSKGLEASLDYHGKIGGVGYSLGGFATYSTNNIDYMAEVITVPEAARTNNPIGSPFGLEAIGFYDIDDFDADGSLKDNLPVPDFGAVQPGDIRYNDVNGDGRIDQWDEVRIGDPYLPTLMYAFSVGADYRGFDVHLVFQGAAGRFVNLLDAWHQTVAFVNNGNAYELAMDRWAYYPEQGIDTRAEAKYPRLTARENNNNYRNSTFWMKGGDFLRLRTVEVGYTLSNTIASKLRFQSMRVFVNAANVFTLSGLLKDYNIDPETMSGYPALRSVAGGIRVNI